MKTKLSPSKAVAVLAVILALTFVTSLLPAVFLIPLIVAAIIFGTRYGFIASCFFAAVSIIYAFTMPASVVAVTFTQHPWVAIVPRLPLGVICALTYKAMTRTTANSKKRYLRDFVPVHVAATAASLLNTVLVVTCLVVFYGNDSVTGNGLDTTIIASVPYMLIMSVVEVATVNVVCPLLIAALKFRRGKQYIKEDIIDTGKEADGDINVTIKEAN